MLICVLFNLLTVFLLSNFYQMVNVRNILTYMNGSRNLYLTIWNCFKWLEKSLFNMTLFQMVRELFILKAENVSNGLRILYLKSDIVLNGLRSDFVFNGWRILCLTIWHCACLSDSCCVFVQNQMIYTVVFLGDGWSCASNCDGYVAFFSNLLVR